MLNLKHIKKSYETADFTQVALNDVSISFRANEFAAILGPSGSGKTTLLNIIGGLDQYDSGDLEIEGISTKKFKDHDWDTYRNNRIGFVFQSYNLIPHQTVLANVELALTLSGVSKNERRKRAQKALEEVGLGEHTHKLPSQLSGGQMQRVAIARALINDPEILLADEPTGALDTTTSTQVMDLLADIAKERLVIMVTHNSELAQAYANRILHLKDGLLLTDTNTFKPRAKSAGQVSVVGKASMSFITAMMLSFSNLMTKKGRTLVTSFAGSIGIIGIAAIIALSNGINAYIESIEDDILSLYPLTIQTTGFDIGAMMGGAGGVTRDTVDGFVEENRILGNRFALRNENDLAALKVYLEANREQIDPLINGIHYMYHVTPQIFLPDAFAHFYQVSPDPIFADFGMGRMLGFGGGFGMNVFNEIPGAYHMFESQYDILAGAWPINYDEAVLILPYSGRVSDVVIYAMGLRDRSSLHDMLDALMGDADEFDQSDAPLDVFSYEEILAVSFQVINSYAWFAYDENFHVWVSQLDDEPFMTDLITSGITLRIVGIVRPNSNMTALSSGIHYTPYLTTRLMEQAGASLIVQNQLENPEVNVFTGLTFAEEAEAQALTFDFSRLITVDEDVIRDQFITSQPEMALDFSDLNVGLDLGSFQMDASLFQFDFTDISMPTFDFESALTDIDIVFPPFDVDVITESIGGQLGFAAADFEAIILDVMMAFFLEVVSEGITDPLELMTAFNDFIENLDIQELIENSLLDMVDGFDPQAEIVAFLAAYIEVVLSLYLQEITNILQLEITSVAEQFITNAVTVMVEEITQAIAGQMVQLTDGLGVQMASVMTEVTDEIEAIMTDIFQQFQDIDPAVFMDAFELTLDDEELFQLLGAMMNTNENNFERNLALLGFADEEVPVQISIFPRSFESKEQIMTILDDYNQRMEEMNQPELMIQYTDLVGALMSSITDIINMVSYGLVAFVSISLLVSSIMIGVITYISVLERKKEIGILRAIGASKRNIRRVFNAETLIVGFVAGLLGVLITLLIAAIANIIVLNRFGIQRIARLPITAILALISTSMFLTFIAGLIPSSAAAKKDPIEALRSE